MYSVAEVSALSGESILGPPLCDENYKPKLVAFQHSLVSLFWGHPGKVGQDHMVQDVSALSGESILGPPGVLD